MCTYFYITSPEFKTGHLILMQCQNNLADLPF